MKQSPLNNIRIASPCSANWDEMIGDNQKRYCGNCKLNVYNLSGMSKDEAENLLLNSEGRLCVRFFRRQDGTVLTKDCPVGWAKVKQRISRVTTATFSLFIGVFGGLFAFNSFREEKKSVLMGDVAVVNSNATLSTNVKIDDDDDSCEPAIMGNVAFPREEMVGKIAVPTNQIKRKR